MNFKYAKWKNNIKLWILTIKTRHDTIVEVDTISTVCGEEIAKLKRQLNALIKMHRYPENNPYEVEEMEKEFNKYFE